MAAQISPGSLKRCGEPFGVGFSSGVPQGSVLSSLVFHHYGNNIQIYSFGLELLLKIFISLQLRPLLARQANCRVSHKTSFMKTSACFTEAELLTLRRKWMGGASNTATNQNENSLYRKYKIKKKH